MWTLWTTRAHESLKLPVKLILLSEPEPRVMSYGGFKSVRRHITVDLLFFLQMIRPETWTGSPPEDGNTPDRQSEKLALCDFFFLFVFISTVTLIKLQKRSVTTLCWRRDASPPTETLFCGFKVSWTNSGFLIWATSSWTSSTHLRVFTAWRFY